MKSFVELEAVLSSQPARLGVLLSRIDVGKGRERLHQDQLPELLRALADQTRVESIRASTAIEGYDVAGDRARKIAPPEGAGARVRNRNEREFAGYRDAIDELMRSDPPERISVPLILQLHRLLYSFTDGRGGHLKSDANLIASRDEQGRRTIIFTPPPPEEVEFLLTELIDRYNSACTGRFAHPLVLLSIFVLDFLAIHPVADGNGRIARLLTTNELLRNDYGVARYVSVEQRIFETKNSYYESLRQSQVGWHDGKHDVWPWTEYLCTVLAFAYDAFEAKVASANSTAGMSKQQIVRRHILELPAGREFRVRELRAALPGISPGTLRLVLTQLREESEIAVTGAGPGAVWTRTSISHVAELD